MVIMFLTLLILFFIFSCNIQQPAWNGTIEEVNGISVIYNPKHPIYSNDVLILKEDLDIGDENKGKDYQFGRIRAIITDNKENVYVLDQTESKVKKYDKNGRYILSFGRKGQGPGEFDTPTGLYFIKKRELVVYSFGKLSFFDLNGEFQKSVHALLFTSQIDSQGNIYATQLIPGDKFYEGLKKCNEKAEELSTLAQIEKTPPGPDNKIDAISKTIFYTILHNDYLAWASNHTYDISIVDTAGNITRKIVKDYEAKKYTDQDKKAFLKNNPRVPETRYRFPKYFPPIRFLSSDDEGRIFVMTYETNPEGIRYYDVFDSDGKFMAKIPLKYHPTHWRNGKLYCIAEDSQGFHIVKRYRIRWEI